MLLGRKTQQTNCFRWSALWLSQISWWCVDVGPHSRFSHHSLMKVTRPWLCPVCVFTLPVGWAPVAFVLCRDVFWGVRTQGEGVWAGVSLTNFNNYPIGKSLVHLTGLAKWMETEQSWMKYVNVHFLYGYHSAYTFHVRWCSANILFYFIPEQQLTRIYFVQFCLLFQSAKVWQGL